MALAAIGLFLLAYQWGNQYRYDSGEPPVIGGVLIRPPQPLPDFVLYDTAGEPVERGALLERWSLLGFGHLSGAGGHRGISRLVAVSNRLADAPDVRGRLRLLLATADAAPSLARDFERLSPTIAVLSGERNAITELAAALGADAERVLDGASDTPPTLFLVDPRAELVAIFPGALSAATIAEDVAALAEQRARES